MSVARARRIRNGRYDATTVSVTMPAHIALIVADRIEMTQDRQAANARFQSEMREIIEISEDAMKDSNLRFQYAMTDLELFLMEAIGRQPMTVQEVREQRQITEARTSPQPFVRKKPPVQISNELSRSIRERRIGNPREPGEDG